MSEGRAIDIYSNCWQNQLIEPYAENSNDYGNFGSDRIHRNCVVRDIEFMVLRRNIVRRLNNHEG